MKSEGESKRMCMEKKFLNYWRISENTVKEKESSSFKTRIKNFSVRALVNSISHEARKKCLILPEASCTLGNVQTLFLEPFSFLTRSD